MTEVRRVFEALVDDPPVACEPIDDLRVRAADLRGRRRERRAATALVVALAVLFGIAVAQTRPPAPVSVATEPSAPDTSAAPSVTTTAVATTVTTALDRSVPPFMPPPGLAATGVDAIHTSTGVAPSFLYGNHPDPLARVIPRTLAVTLVPIDHDQAAGPAPTSPADLASRFTGGPYEDIELGGRHVARSTQYQLAGADLGLPDRHGYLYVFRATSGDVMVEISSSDVDESVVAAVIASFDDARAAMLVG